MAYRIRTAASRWARQALSLTVNKSLQGAAAEAVVRGAHPCPSRRIARQRFRLFSSFPDHIVVGMPALSPTMTHGNIGAWGKQVGDEIAAGDVVCEVQTDKATVDFDAQDDSFMAKHLVEAGSQDIPVGTPIFVTVEDADSVTAFKDFTVDAGPPAPAAGKATPVEIYEETPPASPLITEEETKVASKKEPKTFRAETAASAPPAPKIEAPIPAPVDKHESNGQYVFKRDWGSGVRGSPLAHRMSAEQKRYVERFGSTLQTPLEP